MSSFLPAILLENQDFDTARHSRNVSVLSYKIAKNMGLKEDECLYTMRTALLHDVGKILTPPEVLFHKGKYPADKPEMWETMKEHSQDGHDILNAFPQSSIYSLEKKDDQDKITVHNIWEQARDHHRDINGEGYPANFKPEELSLFTKIVTVADRFEAIQAKRVYHDERSIKESFDILDNAHKNKVDGKIVEVLKDLIVKEKWNDENMKTWFNNNSQKIEDMIFENSDIYKEYLQLYNKMKNKPENELVSIARNTGTLNMISWNDNIETKQTLSLEKPELEEGSLVLSGKVAKIFLSIVREKQLSQSEAHQVAKELMQSQKDSVCFTVSDANFARDNLAKIKANALHNTFEMSMQNLVMKNNERNNADGMQDYRSTKINVYKDAHAKLLNVNTYSELKGTAELFKNTMWKLRRDISKKAINERNYKGPEFEKTCHWLEKAKLKKDFPIEMH